MKGPAPKPEIIMGLTFPDDGRPSLTFGGFEIPMLRVSYRDALSIDKDPLPDRCVPRTPGVYEIADAWIEIPLT